MTETLRGERLIVTGGTGSWGKCAVRRFLTMPNGPERVIVLADSEGSHAAMRSHPEFAPSARLEYFLGNVRELDRLKLAFRTATVVIHAAALKEVPSCEYNLFEAVKTNVLGTQNVVEAAIACQVPRVFLLSTDKAAAAYTSYGKTKALAEDIFVRGNSLAGAGPTRFSVARYGNIQGSRESVIPKFLAAVDRGDPIPITDERMTRYWWTLDEAVAFVIRCLERMSGGEIWIPKIPSASLADVAEAIAPGWPRQSIGIRTREKLHELLVSEDEATNTVETDDAYVILPVDPSWPFQLPAGARPVPEGFRYGSDQAPLPCEYRRVSLRQPEVCQARSPVSRRHRREHAGQGRDNVSESVIHDELHEWAGGQRTIAIVQARLGGSTRFQGGRKVLADLCGHPVIWHVVQRAKQIPGVSQVVVAMPGPDWDEMGLLWHRRDWPMDVRPFCFWEYENDVLGRFAAAARQFPAARYIRVTADNPLLAPDLAGEVLALGGAYACTRYDGWKGAQWPNGLDAEAFPSLLLKRANERTTDLADREHVTPWIREWALRVCYGHVSGSSFPPENFRVLPCPVQWPEGVKLSIDTQSDLEFVRQVMQRIPQGEYGWQATYRAVTEVLGGKQPTIVHVVKLAS